MKLSRNWLSEFTVIDASSKEYSDKMTMSGSKVEGYEEIGGDLKNIVVGCVLNIKKHENSDHLLVCSVDVGRMNPITIVTGAQNVSAGDLVPVALDNSTVHGGMKINSGILRGVVSEGMLCSLKELGLTVDDFPYADAEGIFIIQEDCSAGDDVPEVLGLRDEVIDFEITSNRPDCLSVRGLALESAVTFGTSLHLLTPVVRGSGDDIKNHLSIEIADSDLCPRYTARMVKNIKIAPSPNWMRRRLRASGVRPINNIIDITNYVMLEYGQPMHAFDYSCVSGSKIVVRRANDGESMTTLDETRREFTPDMLLIADASKPVGIAGIMGGENSGITEATKMVVFESANFNGASVRRTAIKLGMRTDASSRFEKGLDPMNTLPAVSRACELVELLGAGEVIDGVLDICAKEFCETVVLLENEKINSLLGTDISPDYMKDILMRLGFTIDGNRVRVPSWRGDVTHYADLAEEVARFYGYNVIPSTMFSGVATQGGLSERQSVERLIGTLCRGMGFSQILTYSFFGKYCYDNIRLPDNSPLRESVTILNPLGEDTSIMRTTATPSMLEILSRNYNYRNKDVRLYELARVYRPVEGEPLAGECAKLMLGAYGNTEFYSFKGCVNAILNEMRVAGVRYIANRENPTYHPGRCADIYSGNTRLGVLGQIHPEVSSVSYDIHCEVYVAELDLDSVLSCREAEKGYEPLPRFPSTARDIAIVCDDAIPVSVLADCITRGGGELLRTVSLFDVYKGSPVPSGKKSAAFSLLFRADDRTLTDEEADEMVNGILKLLGGELDAAIR